MRTQQTSRSNRSGRKTQAGHLGRRIWAAIPADEDQALGLAEIAGRAGTDRNTAAQYLARWAAKGVLGTRPDPEYPTRLRRWRRQEGYTSVAMPRAKLVERYLAGRADR